MVRDENYATCIITDGMMWCMNIVDITKTSTNTIIKLNIIVLNKKFYEKF